VAGIPAKTIKVKSIAPEEMRQKEEVHKKMEKS
jgi:hypothetical protein